MLDEEVGAKAQFDRGGPQGAPRNFQLLTPVLEAAGLHQAGAKYGFQETRHLAVNPARVPHGSPVSEHRWYFKCSRLPETRPPNLFRWNRNATLTGSVKRLQEQNPRSWSAPLFLDI